MTSVSIIASHSQNQSAGILESLLSYLLHGLSPSSSKPPSSPFDYTESSTSASLSTFWTLISTGNPSTLVSPSRALPSSVSTKYVMPTFSLTAINHFSLSLTSLNEVSSSISTASRSFPATTGDGSPMTPFPSVSASHSSNSHSFVDLSTTSIASSLSTNTASASLGTSSQLTTALSTSSTAFSTSHGGLLSESIVISVGRPWSFSLASLRDLALSKSSLQATAFTDSGRVSVSSHSLLPTSATVVADSSPTSRITPTVNALNPRTLPPQGMLDTVSLLCRVQAVIF